MTESQLPSRATPAAKRKKLDSRDHVDATPPVGHAHGVAIRRLVVLTLLGVITAACGSTPRSVGSKGPPARAAGTPAASAAELRDRLQARGICAEGSAPLADATGKFAPADKILCTGTNTLALAVYSSDADREHDLANGRTACPSLQDRRITLIEGSNWLVRSYTDSYAEAVASALDAPVMRIDC